MAKRKKEKIDPDDKSVLREIIEMVFYLLGILFITFLVITFIFQRTSVKGSSMETTLSDKDSLIVDKISYRFRDPKRYDIIVFPYQHEKKTYYIKRIIGLPGETVQIGEDGTIYIDGEELKESYGAEVIKEAYTAADPIKLGDDEYFVLGDNRNNSSDSRDPSVGLIHQDDIVGRAFIRIWPLNKIGILEHQ